MKTGEDRLFHLWLRNEYRTDGVQSDWLKEQLRRRAEEAYWEKFIRRERAA